jgi:CHAT domain-containing protein/tetratricopeptide (TPR) repeat protein
MTSPSTPADRGPRRADRTPAARPRLHSVALRPYGRRLALAVLCLGFVFAREDGDGNGAPRGLLRDLAREVRAFPTASLRLSISPTPEPCAVDGAAATAGHACLATFLETPSEGVAAISRRAATAVRERADPDAMHVQGVIELLYAREPGNALRRSISLLQTAARLSDHPGPVLGDLAAAYLIRAERDHTPRDLLAAIDAAEAALEHDPRNRVALFNRALALQRFGLAGEAVRGWQAYLAVDPRSAWAREARTRLGQALRTASAPAPPPPPGASAAVDPAYAAADPQGARELGWRLLGEWGERLLAGNAARAEGALRRAAALGAALQQRAGGDATLADAVAAIRGSQGDAARQRLARAHREFTSACALADLTDFPAAGSRFATVLNDAAGSPALWQWARVLYGDMVFHTGDTRAGEDILREMAAAVDPVRHPALSARAHQGLAAVLIREDRYDAGLQEAQRATELFTRAGERQNEGIALDQMALAQFAVRAMDEGYALEYRALLRLQPYRGSYRLYNLLNFAAQTVQDDGFPRAAARMQDEAVGVAERTAIQVLVAEAYLSRARLRATAGGAALGQEDVIAGRKAIERITIPKAREWMLAQLQIARAATSLRAAPARAAPALDSAAAFLLGMHAPLAAFPAVVGGAQARLAAGDAQGAAARLESALGILEQRRDSIRMEPRRAAMFETARAVVDRVVMLKLAAGKPAEALRYLERGRASLAPVGPAKAAGGFHDVAAPPGEVALEYALVGDTLLAWTLSPREALYRSVVDTAGLVRTIAHLRDQLEGLAGEAELRPGLASLYDLLVRPVEERLGGPGLPLVIVADGDLASVPFAALYDTARRRYLVEDHPLRFTPSLREARWPARRGGDVGETVFVADPAFDPAKHRGFPRLPEAAGEVREIAPSYPGARVLADVGADRWAVEDALRRADIVHYAGHAVFDDERPERSYLLLAPSTRRPGAAVLQASEIAQMDLRHLSLVVLSACQTVRTGDGRAAGFSGLAGAFLAAGARGALGSLWEVDDHLSRRFMVEFHHAYRGSHDAAGALRTAQLRMLRSGDPALRSPAAWAGFRYLGR